MTQRISIHVATRDRHSEFACLLTSLRMQSFQDWDLVIVDESETPLTNHAPSSFMLNRLRFEYHKINYMRNTMRSGVCNARNICIDNDYFNNPLILRVDDDVVLDHDYIEKLYNVLGQGYDLASGVTPSMQSPIFTRDPIRLNGIINIIEWDKDGNIIKFGDDCGMCYQTNDSYVLNAHHFRSCALYKSKYHKENIRYENNLSNIGFREESFFSLRLRYAGCKIGVDLSARAWHFQSPSGGCRFPNYSELVRQDDEVFKKWSKKMFKKNGGAPK